MQSQLPKDTQYLSRPTRFMTWGVVVAVSLALILTFSKTAHAGLVSFMSSLLGSKEVAADVNRPDSGLNLQTVPILSSAVNHDPLSDSYPDIVPVDDGETLVPDLAASESTSTQVNSKISTYVVQKGDTVSSIAKMFNVSVNTILWTNSITGKTIQPGQTLVILPISGITYKVKSGDTVSAIAKKYGVDAGDIISYNGLTDGTALSAGKTIIIPNAAADTAVAAAPSVNPSGSKPGKVTVGFEPLLDNVSKLPSYPGYFSCPIVGIMTQELHGHNAVDIADPVGTPIRASAAGTVIISKTGGSNGGYGTFVVVSHSNDSQTLYAHMSRTAVAAGDTVAKGQTIGYIGMTGLTTGPHVHFEVRGAKNPFGALDVGSVCR